MAGLVEICKPNTCCANGITEQERVADAENKQGRSNTLTDTYSDAEKLFDKLFFHGISSLRIALLAPLYACSGDGSSYKK